MCIFCDVASGKQKADLVYRDKEIVAFNDIKPKAPIHILFIPRKHIDSILALQKRDLDLIAKLVWKAREIALEKGAKDGFRLIFNCGRAGGQVVDHLHLHLLAGL